MQKNHLIIDIMLYIYLLSDAFCEKCLLLFCICSSVCSSLFYHSAYWFSVMQSISSSLGANLLSSTAASSSGSTRQVNIDQTDTCGLEEDMDVPEIVEEIIDLLLTGLRDSVCSHLILYCKTFSLLSVSCLINLRILYSLL